MARNVKPYDRDEERKRFGIEIKAAQCPGLLEFLEKLPYGTETPAIRSVFYQWFLKHEQEGTLEDALESALTGPGGMLDSRRITVRLEAPPTPVRQRSVHVAQPAQRVVAAPRAEATSSRETSEPRKVVPMTPPAPAPMPTELPRESVIAANTLMATGTGQSGNAASADDEPATQAELDILMDLDKMLGI